MSKAWTAHERELPCFYREALARLLCLEHFRNLFETQDANAGTTIYTDHAPSTCKGSLSNEGRLSSWRMHETQDLADMVQTLCKAGAHLSPPHGLADALSRLPRIFLLGVSGASCFWGVEDKPFEVRFCGFQQFCDGSNNWPNKVFWGDSR